jgi:hypothetical protein
MPALPDRPDIDQLRHQARDLHRAAAARELDAVARIGAVSDRISLASAQLALAREYGHPSWPALRARSSAAAPARNTYQPGTSAQSPDGSASATPSAAATRCRRQRPCCLPAC